VKLAAALLLALVLPGHASAACKTIVVTKAAVSYPHATTIQRRREPREAVRLGARRARALPRARRDPHPGTSTCAA